MTRPIESDFASLIAYARALEAYCGILEANWDKLTLVLAERTVERDRLHASAKIWHDRLREAQQGHKDEIANKGAVILSLEVDCREMAALKAANHVLDANKAWAEYQNRMGIMRVFEDKEK